MDEQRQVYIDGYLNGVIGNFYYDWDEDDINYVLSGVLKEGAHEQWWTMKMGWKNGREETPRNMWAESFETAKEVHDRVLSYLDTSFS